jgi:uncharacterized protein YhdP
MNGSGGKATPSKMLDGAEHIAATPPLLQLGFAPGWAGAFTTMTPRGAPSTSHWRRHPNRDRPVSALHISLKLATRLLEAAIALVVISYLLLGVGLLTLRYAVLPNAQEFVPWMEQASSRALGLPVHIGAVQSRWTGLLPTLSLRNLVIDNPQGQPALQFASVEALPSWKSLPRMQLIFDQLVIRGAQLSITRPDAHHLDVGGIRVNLSAPGAGAGQRFADWLFKQNQILIQNSQITWTDQVRGSPPLLLRDVNLELSNGFLRHRAALTATPPPALAAPFGIKADFRQPFFLRHTADLARWHGLLWADFSHVDLGQLARYLPLPAQAGGSGALRAWVSVGPQFSLGQVTANLALRDAQAQLNPALPVLALAEVRGRIRGAPLPGGLQLSVAGLQFTTAQGQRMPAVDASLQLQHPSGQGASGSLSTGALNLAALSAVAQHLPLPATWHERLEQLQPRGRIDQLKLHWQDAPDAAASTLPTSYTLQAHFTRLGWNSPGQQAAAGASASQPAAQLATHPATHPAANPAAPPAVTTSALAPIGIATDDQLPRDIPGVDGLSGSIQADQRDGQATLTLQNGAIALPALFEAPRFAVQQLNTTLSWSRQSDGQWSVQTARLQLATPDAAGSSSFRYTTQAHGPGLLDLNAQLTRADARAVPAYLPLGIPEATRDFLRSAIAGGSSRDVRFAVHGALADFPFDKPGSPGSFSVQARIEGGVFNAAPLHILAKGEQARADSVHANAQWPEFDNINGLLQFTGHSLRATGVSASVYGASLQQVSLSLPNFSKPVLSASGQVQAQAADALRYVRESPLDALLGHTLSQVQATGPLKLNLALQLPLHDMKQAIVKGQLDLLGNQVDFMPSLPPFDGVRGQVNFTDTGFKLQLAAQNFLGGPLQLSGGQASGQTLALLAHGTAMSQALQAAPRLAQWSDLLRHLQGQARYTANITTERTAQGLQPLVQLHSNLVGMAIDLPPPLGKVADATDALSFNQSIAAGPAASSPTDATEATGTTGAAGETSATHLASAQNTTSPLSPVTAAIQSPASTASPSGGPLQSLWRIDLGGDLRARFLRNITSQGAELQSGSIALGPQAELAQPASGVQANVVLPLLDVDAWQRVFATSGSAQAAFTGQVSGANASGYLPQALSLRVGSLTVSGRVFNDVVLGAQRSGSQWRANIASRQLGGAVDWQMGQGDAPGSITARLTHLSLPKNADPDVERLLEQQPRNMPALNVVAENVDLHGHAFSRLEVQATNRDQGGVKEWRLDRFALDSPDANLTGVGDWVATGAAPATPGGAAPRRTSIGFKLAIHDAGGLLARLGKPGLLKGGKGAMQGTVTWIGSPLSPDYPTLSGQFSLDLGKGQFLKADPGIAKLLGVLSLQSLPRRLLFNFSDVFESGFVFDKVGADVQVQDGIATTHNFKMSGVAATVFIDGSANLAQETQNLYVVVVPEINAGSASLAYALINPAIGLGTFIAQLIARKPLMKAFTYGYRVTGTWAKPNVREDDGDKDKSAAPSRPAAAASESIRAASP